MSKLLRLNRRVLNVATWDIEFRQPLTIRCHPGGSTLASRLAGTFVLGFLAICIYLVYQSDTRGLSSTWISLGLVGLLGFGAVLSPLSLVWQYVELRREHKKLIVKRFYWIPTTLVFPVGNFRSITILASEMRGVRVKWRWRVLLFGELGGVDFWVDMQREEPQGKLVPTRVADFVRYLQQLVPLPYQGPQIVEWHARKMARPTGASFTVTSEPTVTSQTYHSLEEVPPELRPKLEKMMEEARQQGVSTVREERITVRDSNGNERVYNSIEELPPEVRARLEAARAKTQDS